MKKLVTIFIITFVGLGIITIEACRKKDEPGIPLVGTPMEFKVPQGWPAVQYNFDSNRITVEGFALGKKLFYDGRLSKDGNYPCASCHQPIAAFGTYDHDLSHGYDNSHTIRNAPPLQNLAWQKLYGADGRSSSLEQETILHITAINEMGETVGNVINKLKADATYRTMFKAAFGNESIDAQRMTKALSQFMLMMVSNNSKYDKVKRAEATFSVPEQLGYDIFNSKCASCHKEPLFTDLTFRNIGIPLNNNLLDFGRMRVTGNSSDSLKFRVPGLRNTEVSYPYGHDGTFFDIDQVLNHYRSRVVNGPTTDPLVANKIPLSNFEIGQLKAFMMALTDTSFLNDRRFEE